MLQNNETKTAKKWILNVRCEQAVL